LAMATLRKTQNPVTGPVPVPDPGRPVGHK
jgi:hypothetical protein